MDKDYRDIFINEEIFKDFYFFNVGSETCSPKHFYGPAIRKDYIIHFIVSGNGIYETNDNQKYYLKEGDFFLIRPNERVYYEASQETPWTYYWLGFNGVQVESILASCHIQSQTLVGKISGSLKEVIVLFERLISFDHFNGKNKLKIYGLFFNLFSCLDGGNASNRIEVNQSLRRKYSESFMLHVQNNFYLSHLTISDIARTMNLNPSYLSQVIKEELGVSPMSYLKDYRLHEASVLLELSDFTVSEISEMVGYDNLSSFSRSFKNRFMQTPSEFKSRH